MKLGNDDGERNEEEGTNEDPEHPPQDLVLDDDAAEFDVLVLHGLRRSQTTLPSGLSSTWLMLPAGRLSCGLCLPLDHGWINRAWKGHALLATRNHDPSCQWVARDWNR
jgi:hypothetical protein